MDLLISSIRRDIKHQPRVNLDQKTIDRYTDQVMLGEVFDPVQVIRDKDGVYWLWNGFHRAEAYERAGQKLIPAEIKDGTERDAFRLSLGANAKNGLPRSNEDRRRAVELALRDEEFVKLSDRLIADMCSVKDQTVGAIRAEMESTAQIVQLDTRIGKDGKERKLPEKKPKTEKAAKPKDGTATTEEVVTATKAGKAAEPVVQEEPPARPPTNPSVDKHGRQIPTHLQPVFSDPVWDELTNLAQQMTVKLGQVGATDGGFYLTKDMEPHDGKMRLRSFEEAKHSIKFCRPEGICPVCDGDGCDHCYKKGFVHRLRFKAVEGVAAV